MVTPRRTKQHPTDQKKSSTKDRNILYQTFRMAIDDCGGIINNNSNHRCSSPQKDEKHQLEPNPITLIYPSNVDKASLNPIVYIPPTFLLVAIVGILIYTYQDTLQDRYLEAIYRLQNYRRQGNVNDDESELTEEQLRELYGGADAGDIPEELLRQFAEEDNNDDEDDEDDDEGDEEDGEMGGEGEQEEVQPQGSTTSARLRMHHEMVQQMRARAGFAPEPFPGDVVPGEEDGAAGAGEDGEVGEDDGGVGSSQGATAHRIKRVGKKKAEKLQRKEQMRAYHEVIILP